MLVFVFGFAVYEARGWQLYARLLPWVLGFPMLVLALTQLVLDIRGKGTKSDDKVTGGEVAEVPSNVVRARLLSVVAYLVGLLLAIWLLGFMVAVALFTFLYLKMESGESWWLSILLSVLTWGFIFGLFRWALDMPFPEGLLVDWFRSYFGL